MLKRRRFILGTLGIGSALVLGWGLLPPRQRLIGDAKLPVTPGQAGFNGWVKIGVDDLVTVMVPKSEMGQGVNTSLAMLIWPLPPSISTKSGKRASPERTASANLL
jgi:isoquinoline 1-oxidoreductase beta subunit